MSTVSNLADIRNTKIMIVDTLDELGNATMLARLYRSKIRYCHELKRWFVWDKNRWVENDAIIWKYARAVIRIRYSQGNSKRQLKTIRGDFVERKDVIGFAQYSSSKSRIQAMISMAANFNSLAITLDQMNTDPFLLNCPNGTYDLAKGEFRKHDPKDMITEMTNVKYVDNAKCTEWLKFINSIMDGDEDMQRYLQEILGYSLSGSTKEQILFLLVGKGANGKSTLLNAFFSILGSYAKTTPSHTFVKSESRALRNDLARLIGARFVSSVEINTGRKLDEALVKSLTGEDKVAARFLRKEHFEFTPQAKFFLAVNVLPEVSGADDGIYRRIKVLPFDVSFLNKNMDKDLIQKLKSESEGILAWAIEGFRRWYERGHLEEPQKVIDASADFRSQMDIVQGFVGDCCIVKKEEKTAVSVLYDCYLEWTKSNGLDAISKKIFGVLVRQKGFKQIKTGSTRYWKGVQLVLMPV